ncbi:protocadherin alpha-3-like [Pseudorasbora parva]|uniref:protocadherin alpha-3-like n=1 Tax=Pseudorasbora parva TaxID=51549 RepID=UPI00351F1447
METEGQSKCRFWLSVLFLCRLWNITGGQFVYSVSEEANPGTTVGNLVKDFNLNIQDLEVRGFHLVSGTNKRYFDVNTRTGILHVRERIDREEICEQNIKCSLPLEAMVSSPLNIYRFEINVVDINDNAPAFRTSVIHLNITESAIPGERFPLQRAFDSDVGVNSVKSYKLSPNEHFSLDVQGGGDQSVSAELVLQKALDREKQPVIQLTLTAVDGGKPPRSGTTEVIVNVVDVNDNIPVFSKSLYKAKTIENAARGTHVITVRAVDLDEGVNGEIIYAIVNHDNDKNVNAFSINPETGEIIVQKDVDYEQSNAIELRVQAKDKSNNPRAAHCKVLVEIIDVNDNIPAISVTSLVSTVKEDAAIGTMVGMITVTDNDAGKNGQVTLKIKGSAPFKVQNSYKNYYTLVVDGPLDRERASEYNVTITATDEGTPPLSSISVIAVHVSDVNDNAPRFPEPVINVYVKENSQIGAVIHTVSALDPDLGDNARITYSLLESSKSGPVTSMININSDSGELHSLQSFNYEEIKTFEFKVQATDSGVPPLSSNVTVNVFILDENDNSPGILAPYSELGSVNTENIPYSADAGYFVAKIRAVDADSGYNALLSYHISEPKGNNLFRIGTSSGEIRTKRRMSDNDLKTHPLVILVCDNGEPSLSATVSIDVVVVESAGDVKTPFRHAPIKEESFSDLNLYLLIAIVCVSVIFLLSLISLIAVKCHRTDGSLGRYSAPMITTHPDGSWSYSKSTQQYDVCFSSDTLKSDVVVFPAQFPPADGELISINGGDTFTRTQTLPSKEKGSVDFEQHNAYEIHAQAKDKGASSRSAHCKILVEVLDINDNEPEISLTSQMNTVREDAKKETTVALITISDKDSGKNGNAHGKVVGDVPFKLQSSYKNYYSLVVDGPLDRERVDRYNVTIMASDEGTPPLSSTRVFTVYVSDVNDNPPRFPNHVINIFVKENGPKGQIIYTMSAADPDLDENSKITYGLLEPLHKSGTTYSVVSINSDSGDLHSLQSFNYEEIKTFQFKVQATDSGVPPLSSNVTVNVFILDENDNSPGILAPYSELGSVNTENIPYSADAGYFVAKIRAVDADSGYNALLSYHISEPKGNNLFRIGTSSGEIRTKRRMSDNDLKTHPLVILVCDNGEPSLSATVSIDVVVVESAGDVKTPFRHAPIKEESFSDLNLYLLIAIVCVSVIFLLSLISLIAVKCHRTDGSLGRYSAPMITTHPDGSWSYSKSTQQYDVCFSSDTLKSDVVVFPAQFPPADGELISINGGDTFTRTQTLPSKEKLRPLSRV